MSTVAEQLALKLKLEVTFHPEIKRVFVSMLNDFKSKVAVTGFPISADSYSGAWGAVLNNHYARVQKAFTHAVLPLVTKQTEEDNNELLALALLTWRAEHTRTQTRYITITNDKDMQEALQMARQDFMMEGVSPSNRELALAATVLLRRKYAGRITSIAMTETQSSAESTKLYEAQIEMELQPTILGGTAFTITTAKKKWIDIGDSKVRAFHRQSKIQEVNINQAFGVAGEYLMYPGDSSLGASVWNVAN